ncbi:MAG: Rpn family recombination-promoting nuclease/putative transposase [Saprospiraceae bacterium]|nr:Rpn family recombination-promoting nuclease/putative transposase [Saprospiraceae bacterium]
MPGPINNIHDKFFKAVVADIGFAREFLSQFLPKEVKDIVDLSSLTSEPDGLITHNLQEYFIDAVFRCKLQNHPEECFINILLEHKSQVEKQTSLQVLGYLAQAYLTQWQNGQKIQPIIPLIYYHGARKWQLYSIVDLMDVLPSALKPYVPDFESIFIDVARMNDVSILALQHTLLRAAVLTQKYSRDPNALLDRIQTIFGTLSPQEARNLLQPLVVYYFEIVDIGDEKLKELLAELPPPIRSDIMSTYDQIIEKGIEKGLEKGIEKGIAQKQKDVILNAYKSGIRLNLIANIVGITPIEVERILKESGQI